jgi:predicted RNA binding protein YcfA (HicA-like mRNA interferase family)
VKRRQLVKHLEEQGCEFYAEGAKHSKVRNKGTGKRSTVPRHNEIDNDLAKDICKQLGVQRPN